MDTKQRQDLRRIQNATTGLMSWLPRMATKIVEVGQTDALVHVAKTSGG